MSTLIESIGFFSDIFDFFLPFILVFAIIYGILMKTKFLSERADVNAMVALAIGLIVTLSGAGKFITTITPMFAMMFIIVFMLFLIFLFFGVEKDFKLLVTHSRMVPALIVLISIIFIFYAIGTLYGSELYVGGAGGGGTTTNESVNVTVNTTTTAPLGPEACDFSRISGPSAAICIISHPKVLGTIVLLGLMTIATFFIIYIPKR